MGLGEHSTAECPAMPVPTEGLCNTILCKPPACCSFVLAASGAGETRLLGTGVFCKHGDAVSPVCSGSASLAPGPRGGGESGPSPSRRVLGGYFCRSDLRGDDRWREGGRVRPHPAWSQGCCGCCRLWSPCLHGAGAYCRLLAQSLMAGSCEISNIFSNYISAMYQPDEVQPTLDMLGHLGDDSTLGLSLPTSQPLAQSTGRTRGAEAAAQGTRHARQSSWLGRALQGPSPTGAGQQLAPCLSFLRGVLA